MLPWPQALGQPTALKNRARYGKHLARRTGALERRESELRRLKDGANATESTSQ
jgi:hypothetical protein